MSPAILCVRRTAQRTVVSQLNSCPSEPSAAAVREPPIRSAAACTAAAERTLIGTGPAESRLDTALVSLARRDASPARRPHGDLFGTLHRAGATESTGPVGNSRRRAGDHLVRSRDLCT